MVVVYTGAEGEAGDHGKRREAQKISRVEKGLAEGNDRERKREKLESSYHVLQ